MTDLTELPEKLYWVKFNGDIVIMDKYNGYFLSGDVPVDYDKIEQILAPVPSYEEWQKLKSEYEAECHRSDELEDSFWKEHKENAKLKDLLKECRQWFDWYHIDIGTGKEYIESWHKKGREIHQRINQALIEKIDD